MGTMGLWLLLLPLLLRFLLLFLKLLFLLFDLVRNLIDPLRPHRFHVHFAFLKPVIFLVGDPDYVPQRLAMLSVLMFLWIPSITRACQGINANEIAGNR